MHLESIKQNETHYNDITSNKQTINHNYRLLLIFIRKENINFPLATRKRNH